MGKKESGSVFVAYLQSGGVAGRGRGTKQTLGGGCEIVVVWCDLSPALRQPAWILSSELLTKQQKKPKPCSVGGLPVRCCGTSSTQTLLPLGNRGVVV